MMTQQGANMTAADYARALLANVDAWYADEIDHETFRARNRVIWDQAQAAGLVRAVAAIVKDA
jgi:hypothetical protein